MSSLGCMVGSKLPSTSELVAMVFTSGRQWPCEEVSRACMLYLVEFGAESLGVW